VWVPSSGACMQVGHAVSKKYYIGQIEDKR